MKANVLVLVVLVAVLCVSANSQGDELKRFMSNSMGQLPPTQPHLPTSSFSLPSSSSSSRSAPIPPQDKTSSSPIKPRQSRGDRPQLTDNQILQVDSTITNEEYEYVMTFLEFDQDLYINEPFVCAGSDSECSPSDCTPCDWSGSEPTGCDDSDCCGATQHPTYPAYNRVNEWCDTSLPAYTKLEFGEPSEQFTLYHGEYKYFRFFVGEEEYCRTIKVITHSNYGTSSLTVNNFLAYPNQTNLLDIEDGQRLTASVVDRNTPGANYAQTMLSVCPNVNPLYERGTYSIAVSGLSTKMEGHIEIHIGDETYPIDPPDDRALCADVPDSEYQGSAYGFDYQYAGHICLEEGVTHEVDTVLSGVWYDLVLPVNPGCHEISLQYNGFTNTFEDETKVDASHLFFCHQTAESDNNLAANIVRANGAENNFYLSACFEEVTYIHCYTHGFIAGKGMYYWSSQQTPLRYKLSEVSPGMLSMALGMGMASSLAPELNYEGSWNWGNNGFSWITQPSSDPLVFWPPFDPPNLYNFSINPLDEYKEAIGTEIKDNQLVVVDLTVRKNTDIRSRDQLLSEGFITVLGVTSETGMPVELCSDDDLDSGKCERGASLVAHGDWTEFLPSVTFASLNVKDDLSSLCEAGTYEKQVELVREQAGEALESDELDLVARRQYLNDLYNAGLARSSCVDAITIDLGTTTDSVIKVESSFCEFEDVTSTEWFEDPCCNSRAQANHCCADKTLILDEELYTDVDQDDIDKKCGNSDCDVSFYSEIATSLNAGTNPLISCASGLVNPSFELDAIIENSLATFLRPCLVQAGYGDTFQGVDCVSDVDCELMDSTCDTVDGICHRFSTERTKEIYFNCFLETMSPSIEHYLRRKVLPKSTLIYPRGSAEFTEAVLSAATITDCVNSHEPLDIQYGERWQADNPLLCKGEGLFYPLATMEASEEEIRSVCPAYMCLGEKTCRYEDAKRCGQVFGLCQAAYHEFIAPVLEDCPTDETFCSVEGDDDTDCSGFVCAVCLGEEEDHGCTVVEGVSTESECDSLVACESPDGSLRFDLTAEECENDVGACTVDCEGESCRSAKGLQGACEVVGVDSGTCDTVGGEMTDGVCLLTTATTEYWCDQAATEFSETTEWHTCEAMDVATCANFTDFAAPEVYLGCIVEEFRDCVDKDECEDAGTCSDIEIARTVTDNTASGGWYTLSYGACLSSGLTGIFPDPEPACWGAVGERQGIFGCEFPGLNEAGCLFWGSEISPLNPHWTSWILPAKTEGECLQHIHGRYGCALPRTIEKTLYFWNETDCECQKGTGEFLFTWTPGNWKGGKPHSLSWREKELHSEYEWVESLSLVTMESWVLAAMESSFVYILKSQLVCETNYVSSSLSTLVCDCVADDNDHVEHLFASGTCYPSNIETNVGIAQPCSEETTVLKGPSSFTTFEPESIDELCTEVSLNLIQRSWFLYPKTSAGVSFQFAERQERGIVVNDNDATVGQLVGDGSRLTFTHPKSVNSFVSCLLVADDDDYDSYPEKDFGVPSADLSTIHPIGVGKVSVEHVELLTYWCATIKSEELGEDGSVAIFPIYRLANYEDEEEDSLTHQTTSLVYTLGACYSFDLLLLLIYGWVMVRQYTMAGKDLPLVTWLSVILGCVCVFRIAFCFVYSSDDGFGDNELAEFVIFEIPTFLLFTGVIWITALFVRFSKKSTFDFQSHDFKIWGVAFAAVFFVWSLFIIITVVYSEVILQEDESDDVCPGRVQSSNDKQEEDARTLSIVYQSIVIFLTLLFSLLFLRQSIKLFSLSKGGSSNNARRFIFRLGAVIVVAFLLRCALFLILLAIDLTSDIYLFVTLMLTEVIMICLIAVEFNHRFYFGIFSSVATTLGATDHRFSSSTHASQVGTSGFPAPGTMDD